jgi:hypothetical protein
VRKEERGEAVVEGEAVLGKLRLRAGTQISIDYSEKPVGFYLHSPQTLQGIAFPSGTYISVSEKGAMTGFTSTKACSIPSFRFAPVLNAEFDEDGILRKCFLAEPAIIQGIKFEKGKEVLLYRDGTLEEWQLPPDKLQKDRYVGKIRLLPDDRIAEKYASGQVEVVVLAGNDIRMIDRIPYRYKITFYPSGAIKEVFVADTCHIQGLPITSQSNAEFYENAKLKTAFLGDSATIDGIAFRGDGFNESWEIGFFENGKIRKGFLNTPQLIGGKKYGTNAKLFFTKSGSVEKEELIEIEKMY